MIWVEKLVLLSFIFFFFNVNNVILLSVSSYVIK